MGGTTSAYRDVFPGILITDIFTAHQIAYELEGAVQAVLNVSEFTAQVGADSGISYRHIPLFDGAGCPPGSFVQAVEVLQEFQEEGRRTIVHCHAGISRSASVVAAHMVRHRREELLTAWEEQSGQRLDTNFVWNHRYLEDEETCRQELFPCEIRRDPTFQLMGTAFRVIARRRPVVYLRPSMWADLFPKIRGYLAGEVA